MAARFIFETSTVRDGNMSHRYGEVDEVDRARNRFLAQIGAMHTHCALMHVAHTDTIKTVTRVDITESVTTIEAEALLTNDTSIALLLLTADCLPVAYFDEAHDAYALAHLGWKPVVHGLATKVVDAMGREYGTRVEDLVVCIGPGISKESYAFESVLQHDPAWTPCVTLGADGQWHVDLKGFVSARLAERGVRSTHISTYPTDTAQSEEYFSHYRSHTTGLPEGRMLTVLASQKEKHP